MTTLQTAAQQALEALETLVPRRGGDEYSRAAAALRAALAQQEEPWPNCPSLEAQNTELDSKLAEMEQADLSRCPQCNGPADNGHDRSIPPNPYLCTKCMAEPVVGIIEPRIKGDSHQTLDDAMQQPRAMAQAYENGYKAGAAAERERIIQFLQEMQRVVGDAHNHYGVAAMRIRERV